MLPVSAVFCSGLSGDLKKSHHFSEGFDPRLEIELSNIAWNLSQIRKRVEDRPVMAVIKGNAYGHGLVEVARFLEREKVKFFLF